MKNWQICVPNKERKWTKKDSTMAIENKSAEHKCKDITNLDSTAQILSTDEKAMQYRFVQHHIVH